MSTIEGPVWQLLRDLPAGTVVEYIDDQFAPASPMRVHRCDRRHRMICGAPAPMFGDATLAPMTLDGDRWVWLTSSSTVQTMAVGRVVGESASRVVGESAGQIEATEGVAKALPRTDAPTDYSIWLGAVKAYNDEPSGTAHLATQAAMAFVRQGLCVVTLAAGHAMVAEIERLRAALDRVEAVRCEMVATDDVDVRAWAKRMRDAVRPA